MTGDLKLRLLRSAFFTFETIFVASFIAGQIFVRKHDPVARAFGLVFVVSLAGLLIVCFCLRRSARKLAVISWITAFVLFWVGAFTPEL